MQNYTHTHTPGTYSDTCPSLSMPSRMVLFKKIVSKDGGQFRIGIREAPGDEPTWPGLNYILRPKTGDSMWSFRPLS